MKRNIFLMILFISSISFAQVVNEFDEKIFFENNGKAKVVWNITFQSSLNQEIFLPYNFNEIKDVKIESENCEAKLIVKGENKFIAIRNVSSSNIKLKLYLNKFIVLSESEEFGNYVIKYRFINTTFDKINKFNSYLVLPIGFVVSTVDETIPKQSEDNQVFHFQIGKIENRNSVQLLNSNMKLGDQAFIKLQIKHEKKSPVVFIIFSLFAIGYLYLFRDLISKNQNKI